MNTYFLVSAAVMFILCLNHSISGDKFIIQPILRIEPFPQPAFGISVVMMKRIVRFSWHLWSVPWLGFVATLIHFSRGPLDGGALFGLNTIMVVCIASAIITAAISRGKHFAWPLFLLEAGLLWAGLP